MKIKAFIIHLQRAEGRRTQVQALEDALPMDVEIVDAVDSLTLSDGDIQRAYKRNLHAPRYPFDLSRNEIACFLSHRKTWQAIVDQNLDAGLVLEDDVELTDRFPAALKTATAHLAKDGFVRFSFKEGREEGREIYKNDDVRLIEPNPVGLGMVTQLISRDAAQKLLDVTAQFDRPVDTTAQMNWVTGLKPLTVMPGGIREVSSQLGGSTIQHKKSFTDKLKREIMRPIYRMRVRQYSASGK